MGDVQIKERPILFSAPMVRAILEGRKTQTRRIVNWPLWVTESERLILGSQRPATGMAYYEDGRPVKRMTCPYGGVGDRLWVRETIRRGPTLEDRRTEYRDTAFYAADGETTLLDTWPWKRRILPAIHMPRGLSRITLEVTDVRVEQLNYISEDDARAEGVAADTPIRSWTVLCKDGRTYDCFEEPEADDPEIHAFVETEREAPRTARANYQRLWDSINSERVPWSENPWVWAVSFKQAPGR